MTKVGLIFISVGAGAIGLLQAKDFVPAAVSPYLTADRLHVYTVVSLGLTVAGLIVFFVGHGAAKVSGLTLPRRFASSLARTSDVSEVHAFAAAILGPGISGINQMKAWLKKYERSIVLVYSEKRAGVRRERTIVGYFCLLPLTDAAAMALANGGLQGSQLQDTHLATTGCNIVYLGGVAARGKMGRGVALGALQQEFERIRRQQIAQTVYTRPINAVGLGLATAYGFTAIVGGGPPRIRELAQAALADILD